MKTMILSVPETKEKWFQALFDQFHVKHRTLSDEGKADLILAKLIDEAMSEKGEVSKEKVNQFLKKYGNKV